MKRKANGYPSVDEEIAARPPLGKGSRAGCGIYDSHPIVAPRARQWHEARKRNAKISASYICERLISYGLEMGMTDAEIEGITESGVRQWLQRINAIERARAPKR